MYVLDGHQRMFVDRVAVVVVANHKRIDCLELGKQQDQHPQPVHGAERGSSMRRYQDASEVRPHLGRILRPGPKLGKRRFDAAFGFRSQLQAVTADKLEKSEQHRWILDRRKLAQKDPALRSEEHTSELQSL